MRIRSVIGSLIALMAVAPTLGQTPLGTAFLYQGQLKAGGAPFDGTADFQFTLWDAAGSGNPPKGGTQVGQVQAIDALPVTAGLFTATLNPGGEFAGNAFNGNARWLQIAVRSPAGGGVFTTLAPRQPLAAVPYASFALGVPGGASDGHSLDAADGNPTDALFVDNAGRVGIGTTSPDNTLHVLKGSAGAVTGHFNAALVVENSTTAYINLLTPDANERGILFGSPTAGATAGGIIYNSAATPEGFQFRTNGNVNRMVIDSTGNVGIGVTNSLSGKLDVRTTGATGVFGQSNNTSGNGVFGYAPAVTGTNYGGFFQSDSTTGRGVYGHATAATGTTYGVFGHTHSPDGRGVYGLAAGTVGTNSGVYGQSFGATGRGVFGEATGVSGVTTGVWGYSESTGGRGVFGIASALSGVTYGVYSRSDSTSGRGVLGNATASGGTTYGGYFQSASNSGTGVFGEATSSTGTTYGVRGESTSGGGSGVFGLGRNGVYGQSVSTSGYGVFGEANAATGFTYGGKFESESTSGTGVAGFAYASGGSAFGVYGQSSSTSGRGVEGYATALSGITYGVYGRARINVGYGVQGSGGTYAVYAAGDTGASGTKSFRIDHPDDPANKYLLHYATESPEVINFYRGTVVLDGTGESVVELPHYFAKINKTPSYQLTAVGAPMPMLHVAEEIDDAALSAGATAGADVAAPMCSFRIAGGAPGAKVSWEVKAVRNDLWVQNHALNTEVLRNGLSFQTRAMPVEVEKQGMEKGTYQHPEHYGQPAEMGMNYDATRADRDLHDRPDTERPASRTLPNATPQ